jgi:hypothetical protein
MLLYEGTRDSGIDVLAEDLLGGAMRDMSVP